MCNSYKLRYISKDFPWNANRKIGKFKSLLVKSLPGGRDQWVMTGGREAAQCLDWVQSEISIQDGAMAENIKITFLSERSKYANRIKIIFNFHFLLKANLKMVLCLSNLVNNNVTMVFNGPPSPSGKLWIVMIWYNVVYTI